jgi:hypothetical protein
MLGELDEFYKLHGMFESSKSVTGALVRGAEDSMTAKESCQHQRNVQTTPARRAPELSRDPPPLNLF